MVCIREYGVDGRDRDENRNKKTAKQRHIEAYVERDSDIVKC